MKYRLLIAEDDKHLADRIKFWLSEKVNEDLDVTVVYGADKETSKKRYDIAIVDLNMPYLDSDLYELDENAGEYVINNLVTYNPDIFIIIQTSVQSRETVAKASNVAGRGSLKFIDKTITDDYQPLIDEVIIRIQQMKEKHPSRIDYGDLTYIHKVGGNLYEYNNWTSYRHDDVYIKGKLVTLPAGGQKAALYKYLVNKETWVKDNAILQFSGSKVDDLDNEKNKKRYRDNILTYLRRLLQDAGLTLESRYGEQEHRLTKKRS